MALFLEMLLRWKGTYCSCHVGQPIRKFILQLQRDRYHPLTDSSSSWPFKNGKFSTLDSVREPA